MAVKCVDCRRFRSIAELEAVHAEIALLSSLRHRYIVRLLGVEVTPSHIYFAMEHAGGGTLAQLLQAKVGAAACAAISTHQPAVSTTTLDRCGTPAGTCCGQSNSAMLSEGTYMA